MAETKELTTENINEVTKLNDKLIGKAQYDLVKNTVAKGATDTEFQLLVYTANKYKLDPLLREIWCVKRNANDPALIFTSRDGFYKVAQRSGKLDGINSGVAFDDKGALVTAWAEVWVKGSSHSFREEVYLAEYKGNSPIWNKMPITMLKKVAEIHALKKAFNISGMYGEEEADSMIDTVIEKPKSIESVAEEKEKERVMKHIEKSKTLEKLQEAWDYVQDLSEDNEIRIKYMEKHTELEPKVEGEEELVF